MTAIRAVWKTGPYVWYCSVVCSTVRTLQFKVTFLFYPRNNFNRRCRFLPKLRGCGTLVNCFNWVKSIWGPLKNQFGHFRFCLWGTEGLRRSGLRGGNWAHIKGWLCPFPKKQLSPLTFVLLWTKSPLFLFFSPIKKSQDLADVGP